MTEPLSPGDRARLEELFERASELPREEHAAFLDRACGAHASLRGELRRLLAGLSGEDVLGRIQQGAPSRAGTRIGPYELLERIGEGGMGEVYLAEQTVPLVRRVALKVIKPGMDTAQVVARFEAERQALARMSHPNVAQVYDGGSTGDGRPYFVMEYVAGEPLTRYCDERKLPTRARLELFIDICEGVQHAHQKGIVHRDLKPSNLLVLERDGRAVPKVIDFGVARATSGTLGESTLRTMVGQVLGTLDYMSPEQADPGTIDADTRSDVYSLGVVLYELLSGLLPLEHALGPDQPFSEVQRAIREKDPPTPSTRLRRERRTATALAQLHGTNDRTLIRQLSGDLDWICLKALEKDPARRYASASELAADVRRHLDCEPVLARRPGTLYRAGKFVRRNRVAVTAGVLIGTGLLAGIAGIVSGETRAFAAGELVRRNQPRRDRADALALVARADELLWPPHPDKLPAMQEWVEEAREVVLRLGSGEKDLLALRERALPYSAEDQERDRRSSPLLDELLDRRAELRLTERRLAGAEKESVRTRLEARKLSLENQVAGLQAAVDARRSWRFEAPLDQTYHDDLAASVELRRTFSDPDTGLSSEHGSSPAHGWSVPRRIERARELERAFAADGTYGRPWSEARARVRAHPGYGGLDLEPQMGLVPLGPDPDSRLEEFAHLLTGSVPERGADGRLALTDESSLVLVLLPGGTFRMGSAREGEEHADENAVARFECPAVDQSVAPFFLSKFEMTRAQWQRFTDSEAFDGRGGGRLPVVGVTATLCDQTTFRSGLRLPTEIEWEYGCRAGSRTIWVTGDDEGSLEGQANLFDQSLASLRPRMYHLAGDPLGWDDRNPLAAPVDDPHLNVNRFGLHAVVGNVTEWCSTAPFGYAPDPDGERLMRGTRMARGGNFSTDAFLARSASRLFNNVPDFQIDTLGLRPARTIER